MSKEAWKRIKEKVLQIVLVAVLAGIVYFVAGFFIQDPNKRTSLSVIVIASYLAYCKNNTEKIDTENHEKERIIHKRENRNA